MRYKESLLQVAKDWSAHKMEAVEPESDTDSMRPGPSTLTPCGPHGKPHWRLSGDTRKHALEKIVKSEEGKRKYPARRFMFVQLTKKKKKRVKLGTFVSSV
jgi:hypothetical protein